LGSRVTAGIGRPSPNGQRDLDRWLNLDLDQRHWWSTWGQRCPFLADLGLGKSSD